MKRDMSLIRRILLTVEADDSPLMLNDGSTDGVRIVFEDVPPQVLAYHILLLGSAGLVDLDPHRLFTEIPNVLRMTMNGHDYLDSIRGVRFPDVAKFHEED